MTTRLYLAVLAVALVGLSCSKQPQEVPAPLPVTSTLGAISGQVQPAEALFGLRLKDDKNQSAVTGAAVLDSKTGMYHFDAVPSGTYVLYFDANINYVPPRQQTVTVTAGKTTVVPTALAARSTVAFTADGVTFAPNRVDLRLGGTTYYSLIFSDGGPQQAPASATYGLLLALPNAMQVGTYPLNTAFTYAVFTNAVGSFDSRLNPTIPSGGTLTITAVENTPTFPRSVSGTFSFTGTNAALGTQKTISGTFANAYF